MIESTLEFRLTDLRSIVAMFCTLPEGLRPTHHSLGEDEAGELIVDTEKFLDSLLGAGLGPYLKGPRVTYDVSFFDGIVGIEQVKSNSITCNFFLEVEPSLVEKFLVHMAAAQPVFGFACTQEERYQRNRVATRLDAKTTVESWVGRDTQKYVPGFYWLTLLSEVLAETHGVSLTAVERVAQEHVELEDGQHLFRFYERPEDWQATSVVTALCAALPGVFDIEKVKPLLLAAKNFLDLDAMLKNWK